MSWPRVLSLAALGIAALAGALVWLAAPQRNEPATSTSTPDVPMRHLLVGTVRSVDRESGRVTIHHEAIPDYMPAMTMPFNLAGQEVLAELQVGDEVEGTLVVDTETSELVDLFVTRPATPQPVTPLPAPRKLLEIGEEVPDFVFTTQEDERLALSELRGRAVVLTFIYTRCPLPEYCPLTDQKFRRLAELAGLLPEARVDRVRLVSVSIDPEHDTPEVLARHASSRGAEPPLWRFAVAAHDELRRVAEPLGLMYGPMPNEIIHNLITAVIAPDGRLARLESGNAWTPEDLFRTIADLVPPERPATAPAAPAGSSGEPGASALEADRPAGQ